MTVKAMTVMTVKQSRPLMKGPPLSRYVYDHPESLGFGEHHATEHGRELPAEMRDLDMPHGTVVEHAGTDDDTGAVIVAWKDKSGTPRNTAVSPELLATHFTEVTDGEAI
jgi:hypothetical protein